MDYPKEVIVLEVGPRDGLQMETKMLSVEQKVELIERVADAGVKYIEIGSLVHPKAVPQMADTDEVAKRITRKSGVEYSVLVMNLKGVERALDAGIEKIKFSVSASRAHSLKNQNREPEEVVRSLAESVEFAAKHNIRVGTGISMSFGCPFEGDMPISALEKLIEEFIRLGISEIAPADTVGLGNPGQVYSWMKHFKEKYPQVHWGVHLHNTRGLALANTYAALLAGVTEFGSCFAGIGGCPFAPGASGNVATEDVIYLFNSMGIASGCDLQKYIAIAGTVQEWLGHDSDTYQLHVARAHAGLRECRTAASS